MDIIASAAQDSALADKNKKKHKHFFRNLLSALAVIGGLEDETVHEHEREQEEAHVERSPDDTYAISATADPQTPAAIERYLDGSASSETTPEGETTGGGGGNASDPGTQTRARNPEEKREVIETKPVGGLPFEARMTPKEVREMIEGNCSLIKTVDRDLIPGIERRIKRLYEKGNTTPETLARYLERECGLEDWQADRIIRDQTIKYDARVARERMKKQGVRLVRWVHGDSREPREYHIKHWDGHTGMRNGHPNGLAGFVFDIDNPPIIDERTGERGYPGDLIMCSCHLEAVE